MRVRASECFCMYDYLIANWLIISSVCACSLVCVYKLFAHVPFVKYINFHGGNLADER